jgi:hypothetical protein
LAEVFANIGYEAIVYKSQFGEKGFNIVLFKPDDASVINCAPYTVAGLDVSFEQSGNIRFSPKKLKNKKTKSRQSKTRKS